MQSSDISFLGKSFAPTFLSGQRRGPSTRTDVDLEKLFPDAFTFWSVFVLAAPLIKAAFLATDPSVAIGLGSYGDIALPLLIFFPLVLVGVGHCIRKKRGMGKWSVVIGLAGSCLIVAAMANHIVTHAIKYGNIYAAMDCRAFTEKYKVEKIWQAAQTFHTQCLKDANANQTKAEGTIHLISDCPGYDKELKKQPVWDYLATMETDFGCGGWCQPHKSLWTVSSARDSCSAVVSEVLTRKVERLSRQLGVYCIVMVVVTTVWLIMIF